MRPGGWRRLWSQAACRRGTAAVELALAFPVVLVILGNVIDYGLMLRRHTQLATGVANAGYYASQVGAAVSLDTLRSIATASSWLADATASTSAAACYCPTGTPRVLGTARACDSTCGDGSTASKYLTVTGTYAYTPLFPQVIGAGARSLVHSATVMVK